eukprot:11053-Rhodomonas_salina.1
MSGSLSVTILGSSFGVSFSSLTSAFGSTYCEGTDWVSETSVQCMLGRGIGGSRAIRISSGERSGSVTDAWSAGHGTLIVATRLNQPGTGSLSITLSGAGLGSLVYTLQSRLGSTSFEATDWASQTHVLCRSEASVRGTRHVIVTAAERSSTSTALFTVDVMGTSMVRRANRGGT